MHVTKNEISSPHLDLQVLKNDVLSWRYILSICFLTVNFLYLFTENVFIISSAAFLYYRKVKHIRFLRSA